MYFTTNRYKGQQKTRGKTPRFYVINFKTYAAAAPVWITPSVGAAVALPEGA